MKTIKVDKVILYYMDRVDHDGSLYRFYVYKGMASEIEYFCTEEAGNMTIPIGEGEYVKIVPKEIEKIPVRGYRKLAGIWNREACNGKGWYRLFNYFKYKPTLCYFKKAGHDENGNTRYEISLFNNIINVTRYFNLWRMKPGVNVIIGKNGSGKSTLLNIISMYMLCEKSMCSEMPIEALDFPPIFDDDDKVLDGIDISSDYAGKVFRLLPSAEMNRDSVLKNISNLDLYVNNIRRSYGEKMVLSLESLFNLMFGQKDYVFPIRDLVEYKKKSNTFWIKRIDNLLKYYKRNHITLTKKDFEYTVLMDEPDRNLDIDNIMQIYNVLSFHKPQTQIIAIIHNPALIYKLSKLDCVNFIEMTEGYLKDVVNFISETNK